MTTKVRITNIREEGGAQSNGDVVIHLSNGGGRIILSPGESHEEWMQHSNADTPYPMVIYERWPSVPK